MITRLDAIQGLAAVCVILGSCAFACSTCVLLDWEDFPGWVKKVRNASLAAVILGVFTLIFVPNKNEALMILGIGGVVEYVKDSDEAKQLPDKAVDALNVWFEELKKEK